MIDSARLSDLLARVEKLEAQRSSQIRIAEDHVPTGGLHYCSQPETPNRTFGDDVSPYRARLIRAVDKKWVNGTKLHYIFFDGPARQQEIVRQGFAIWEEVGIGLSFQEVNAIDEAEIRIGFVRGEGAWSYVGRDLLNVPGPRERTMNFGWDLTQDPRGVDTPVHEIGHTLGFPHEHQNPFAGIEWNEEAVYSYFGGPPNYWPREQTYFNVLRKLDPGEVDGSVWDPDSVMHYGFAAGLIRQPSTYRAGLNPALGLSESDKSEVRRFYPPLDTASEYAELEPFRSRPLALKPAEQADFVIRPDATRAYTVQTFGAADTVMVLFEEQDGELKYAAADDDSGGQRNSRIRLRLHRGRKYVLRIRLYLNHAAGETAVMLW